LIDTHFILKIIESNTGKSARQGNLRHLRVSLSCTFCWCLILFLTFISSCVLFDSYVLLADDHVNNVSRLIQRAGIPLLGIMPPHFYVCPSLQNDINTFKERMGWLDMYLPMSLFFI
jgi:hypothetical protein